jgi:ComF family protein
LARLAASPGQAADLVVPLPLHPVRLRERGFNQALELARPVAAALGLPLDPSACARVRHTPAQAGLPWKKREENIRRAFHCARDLSGRRILLIDDVMTTGASLDECARTLKRHGAAEVSLLVVARTLP